MSCKTPSEQEALKEKQQILDGNHTFIKKSQLEGLLETHKDNGGLLFVIHAIRVMVQMFQCELFKGYGPMFQVTLEKFDKEIHEQPLEVKALALGLLMAYKRE